jgi:hypothetical protein
MSEKYATCKSLNRVLNKSIKPIQWRDFWVRNGKNKRMLISAGHPCAYALPASPGLVQDRLGTHAESVFLHTKTLYF